MFSGLLLAGNVNAANNIIEFVPGETTVQNGQTVIFKGQCFVAKNNPGIWESPFVDSWFWDVVDCGDDGNGNGGEGENEETTLSIVAPVAGQILKAGTPVAISALVDGNQAAKVEFWVTNSKIAESVVTEAQTSYTQTWTPSEAGNATVRLVVLGKDGQTLEQSSVAVTVTEEVTEEDFTAPVVKFLTPAAGSSVKKGESVAISLNATDVDNDSSKVVVLANNGQICEFGATDAFTCSWTAAEAGSVTLTATATDKEGLT